MVLHDSMADSITHLPNAPCFSPSLILPLVFLFDVFEWDLPVVGMFSFLPNSHAESRALRWEYFKVGPFEGDQIMRAVLSRIRMVSLEKGLQKLHFSYVKTQFKKKKKLVICDTEESPLKNATDCRFPIHRTPKHKFYSNPNRKREITNNSL